MPYSKIYFSTTLGASLNSPLRFRHAPSLPESPPDFLFLVLVPFWQGLPKVMARCRQGVGIPFAYSNRPFEYGNTMRTLCEVREKSIASPNENDLARDCPELAPLLLQKSRLQGIMVGLYFDYTTIILCPSFGLQALWPNERRRSFE